MNFIDTVQMQTKEIQSNPRITRTITKCD